MLYFLRDYNILLIFRILDLNRLASLKLLKILSRLLTQSNYAKLEVRVSCLGTCLTGNTVFLIKSSSKKLAMSNENTKAVYIELHKVVSKQSKLQSQP